ncbi:MAG: hypothetical protein JXQ68_05030 [Campylobacterales bacterium]|nr:hypothetical protein [Campylobacterales bacterium]
MRKDEVYGKILDISKATYFKQVKKNIPIYELLDRFPLEELEEFANTGKLKSLQHYEVWKNSSRAKINLSHKLHNLLTGKSGEFIKNEKLISFICGLFITFRQMRNEGMTPRDFDQIVWSPKEISFNELYSLFILTHNKGNLLEELSKNHTEKYVFEDLHNLLSITDEESHYLAYMMENHLMSLVEWALNNDAIYIFQAKGLVVLSLLLMATDWHQDLEMEKIIKIVLPDEVIEQINKTSSMSKLLKIYHEQITDLINYTA